MINSFFYIEGITGSPSVSQDIPEEVNTMLNRLNSMLTPIASSPNFYSFTPRALSEVVNVVEDEEEEENWRVT